MYSLNFQHVVLLSVFLLNLLIDYDKYYFVLYNYLFLFLGVQVLVSCLFGKGENYYICCQSIQ